MRLGLLLLAAGGLLLACDSKPQTSPPSPASAVAAASAAASPPTPSAQPVADPAVLVAKALVDYYPIACRIADADDVFVECHDKAVGYDRAIACMRKALAIADAELPNLPPADAPPGCAGAVQTSVRESVGATARFLADFVAWMDGNKGTLRKAMARKPLSDACDDVPEACDARPVYLDPNRYPGYGFGHVTNAMACIKPLFVCGPRGSDCWPSEVTSRLGVACDPRENTASPLLSRRTGHRIMSSSR